MQDPRPAVLVHIADSSTGLAICAYLVPADRLPAGALTQACPLCLHYTRGGCPK
jgi:hypothetical protein